MMFSVSGDAAEIMISGLGIFLVFIAMAKLLNADRSPDRILMGGTTALAIGIYATWRLVDTMPPLSLSAFSIWAHVFFMFEMLAIAYSLASIAILFFSVDRTEVADAAEALLNQSGRYPAVDVFICTYNEPINILEKSIVPALALDYPGVTVFVCDDTRRPEVERYCAEIGAQYITRPDNSHAKAGNLNNAFRRTAEGREAAPYILVLDADFAPQRNFLKRVIGLFEDSRIGIVQTPQFYYNCDPIQHNLGLRDSFVDDQRVFFDTFQPAKDAVDCAFCVGTSFVVRREAVEAIGGFPHEALSEDMLLSYRLMERGYVTRWLNERLSVGLSAEGLPEYITQRTRWCLGTIQIGLLKDGPLRGGNFTWLQRAHYLHGLMSWLSKPFIVVMMIAPPLYWFFEVPAFEADHLAFLRFGVPALIGFWIYSSWVSGKRTLPLFTEVTHALTAVPITLTLLAAIRAPFGKPFKVTEKGGDRSKVTVHVGMATMFGGLALASAVAIVLTILGPGAAGDLSGRDLFNLVWAGVAMLTAFIAFLVCFDRPRAGQEELVRVNLAATLHSDQGIPETVTITELSLDHAVLAAGARPLPKSGVVLLPMAGWVPCVLDRDQPGRLKLMPSASQRRSMIVFLFSQAPANIAFNGRMLPSLWATTRNALWN